MPKKTPIYMGSPEARLGYGAMMEAPLLATMRILDMARDQVGDPDKSKWPKGATSPIAHPFGAREVTQVSSILVDSPVGTVAELVALDADRPIGAEDPVTLQYRDLLAFLYDHPDRTPSGTDREFDALRKRIKKQMAKAERYIDKRGGNRAFGSASKRNGNRKRSLMGRA